MSLIMHTVTDLFSIYFKVVVVVLALNTKDTRLYCNMKVISCGYTSDSEFSTRTEIRLKLSLSVHI